MRLSSLIWLSLPVILVSEARSQDASDEALRELYCEICPYDAPVRPIRRIDYFPSRSSTVVTAEDMRALGVVSVADMIRQLPGRATEEADSADSADSAEAAGSANSDEAASEQAVSPDNDAEQEME